MRDIIYLGLDLFTEFFNYSIVYSVLFGIAITRSLRKWVVTVGIIVSVHLAMLFLGGLEMATAMTLVTMILVPGCLLEPLEKKNFILYPFVAIGSSVVGVSISFLLAVLLSMPEYKIAEGNGFTLICQVLQSLPVVIVGLYRKIKKRPMDPVHLDWKQYLLFYIVVISLFLMLAPIQGLTRGEITTGHINLIGFAVSIACIVLVVITIWQGIVVKREIQQKEQNVVNRQLLGLQKEYYNQLLIQDEKMRRFRHDMKAHILAIKSYNHAGDQKSLQSYLDQIVQESALETVIAYTGNVGVDAVLVHLVTLARAQSIEVSIKGDLTEESRIEEFDLCTILSNLFTNAVEACEKIPDLSNRKIKVAAGVYNGFAYISVKNTFVGEIPMKNNRPVTTKAVSKYHGLGTGNVELTARKYEGVIDYLVTDGWFEVKVML